MCSVATCKCTTCFDSLVAVRAHNSENTTKQTKTTQHTMQTLRRHNKRNKHNKSKHNNNLACKTKQQLQCSTMAENNDISDDHENAVINRLKEICTLSPQAETMKLSVLRTDPSTPPLKVAKKAQICVRAAAHLATLIAEKESIPEKRRVDEITRNCPPSMLGNDECAICLEKAHCASRNSMMLACCGDNTCVNNHIQKHEDNLNVHCVMKIGIPTHRQTVMM